MLGADYHKNMNPKRQNAGYNVEKSKQNGGFHLKSFNKNGKDNNGFQQRRFNGYEMPNGSNMSNQCPHQDHRSTEQCKGRQRTGKQHMEPKLIRK